MAEQQQQMITVTLTPNGEFNLQEEEAEPMHHDEEALAPPPPVEMKYTPPATLPPIPFSFPGQTFDTKCQKLILNVWDFFKRVKKNPDIMEEIRTPQERAAAALHISAATIGKIGKNFKKTGKLEAPGASRKRQRPVVDSVNGMDESMIRSIIEEMRAAKITPTLPSVLAEARVRINYTGGATSFRRILARMGYKNLSQKGAVVKSQVTILEDSSPPPTGTGITFTTSSGISFSPNNLKIVKKEGSTSSTVSSLDQQQQQNSSVTNNASSLQGAHIIQIPAGQILTQSEGGVSSGGASTNFASSLQSGHTIYIQGADNTIRPVQIIFSPTNLNLQQ